MGYKTNPGRKHHSCPKIFYHARKRTTEFLLRPKGWFLKQSELGLNFLCWWHTEKQMIPHIQYKDKTIVLCWFIGYSWTYSGSIRYGLWYQAPLTMKTKFWTLPQITIIICFRARRTQPNYNGRTYWERIKRCIFLSTNLNIVLILPSL
jgi:hypothetical protein